MSYGRRVCEGVVLGSILFFSATAKTQDLPQVTSAQAQIPVNQAASLKSPDTDSSSAAVSQNPAPSAPAPSWSFQSLSYVWFPGMSGTVGARGYNTTADISPSDILKNLNIGIMGAFEADHDRWGLPFDYVWAKIQDKKSFVNFPGYSAKATVKEGFFTPKVTYLVVDGKMLKIRATAGLRVWYLGENLQLNPPSTPSFSFGKHEPIAPS